MHLFLTWELILKPYIFEYYVDCTWTTGNVANEMQTGNSSSPSLVTKKFSFIFLMSHGDVASTNSKETWPNCQYFSIPKLHQAYISLEWDLPQWVLSEDALIQGWGNRTAL